MKAGFLTLAIIALISLGFTTSYAAEEAKTPTTEDKTPAVEEAKAPVAEQQAKNYSIRITPYVWFMSTDGDVTVKGITKPFEADFSDIVDKMNIAFMLGLEATWNKFGLNLDGIYADLESETDTPLGTVTVNPTMFIAEADVTYNLFEKGEDPSKGRAWFFDVLGGIRYWNTEVEISLPNTEDVDDTRDFITGLIGGRVRVNLTPKWLLGFRADYGIGSTESDLDQTTWNLVGYLNYTINETFSLDFGYRYMNIEMESDEDNGLQMDTNLFGPVLALTISF